MPAKLDSRSGSTNPDTADGATRQRPQYSIMNFFVYALVALVLLALALVAFWGLPEDNKTNPPDPAVTGILNNP